MQIFEEAIAAGLGREHAFCVFRKTCGDIPVVEPNGDFFSCDHFVDVAHRVGNIMETSLAELLESPGQRSFGQAKLDSLPRYCKSCEVLAMCNGGCPKDRILLRRTAKTGSITFAPDTSAFSRIAALSSSRSRLYRKRGMPMAKGCAGGKAAREEQQSRAATTPVPAAAAGSTRNAAWAK